MDYGSFDLVFVDGDQHSRVDHANRALRAGVPLVVLHDTEKVRYYQWNLLTVPSQYQRYNFRCTRGNGKMTTVFTSKYKTEVSQLRPKDHEKV